MGLAALLVSVPPRARGFLFLSLLGGAAAVAASAALLPSGIGAHEWRRVGLGAALLVATCLFLEVNAPALNWRGRTMSIHLDEGVFLVGFVALPAPVVVLAGVVSTLLSQAWLRKHPVKAAFNASVQAVALALSALAFLAALAAGVPPVGAAVLVPFVMSGAGSLLVGALLSLLDGEPAWRALRPALLASSLLTSVAGATFGVLALGLHEFHPAALVLLLPLGFLFHKALTSEYRHQNELTTRRALQHAHERLVGGPDEDGIVAAGLDACEEALDLVRCELRVGDRAWRTEHAKPAGPTREVAAPLVDAAGRPMGEIRATVVWNGRVRLREDESAVGIIAASLSMALATAAALRSAREARQGLRDVLDAAREPIVAWDPEGRTVHANEAAKALFGDADRDALAALLEPASAEAFRHAMAGPAGETAEVEAWTRDGRALEMRKGPITLAGARVGTLVVARDVTERRRLEREAADHREAMARNERLAALGILAAGVAHEVNSPLFAMQGNLEITLMDLEELEAERPDARLEASREQLRASLSGVERIARITRGLGALGRPDRARPRGAVDLAEAVRLGIEEARRGVPDAAPVELRLEGAPLPVEADPADLRQVAHQLTRNALEAAGPGGRVVVTARRAGDVAELLVEDDGPGVPEGDEAKLFTPFHTTKPEGTGLGLPIALALARSVGGDVAHEARTEGGALFRARFPLRGSEKRATPTLLTADT